MKMDARLFRQMMAFYRLPAEDVVKLLHAGEYQQLKFRAVLRDKRRRPAVTIVGYTVPPCAGVPQLINAFDTEPTVIDTALDLRVRS